jgi:hypothetical protein
MNRGTLILALVSALCLGGSLGFVSGVVFTRYHFRGDGPDHGHGRRIERRGGFGERGVPSPRRLVPHLQRLLDLTPEQTEAIRVEIESTRGEFAKVRDSMHVRIGRHLTPKQRERWIDVMKEHPGEPRGRDPRTFRADPGSEGDKR